MRILKALYTSGVVQPIILFLRDFQIPSFATLCRFALIVVGGFRHIFSFINVQGQSSLFWLSNLFVHQVTHFYKSIFEVMVCQFVVLGHVGKVMCRRVGDLASVFGTLSETMGNFLAKF